MATPYNHKTVEKKWQKYWQENDTFKTDVWDFSKPKYYALDMFPYPSGVGLHAGHPEGYTATDIMSRMKRMQGYNVLHPMGYDSFGLPAEQYAVTTGNHPAGFTEENIETFSKQLKELGFDYDWSKVIATSDPKFYKWTQWIFKKLYEAGYAKHIDMPVNWCEELGTVLSNDEVIDGKSERGGYPVVRKNMKQWVIDQPAFAEKLLEGLEEIDWPESTKDMQRNWIGKSTGVEVEFEIVDGGKFSIFTTCIETIYGITFMVLAPDGEKVADVIIRAHETDYYSTSATDFDYDYGVENLADGWEILVDMSETTAFPNNIKTGEALPCDPSLLISITAKRKNDDGLIPTTYDFDGRQKLSFRFKGIDGIKEIKEVYFTCAENVREADSDWVGWFSYSTEDIRYDFKKGELTIPSISEWVYDKYPSVGNTYQGCMTYVAEDGTEKTAYGDWYIKVLEKSDQPIPDDTDNDSQKPADTPNSKPGQGDAKPGNPNTGNPATVKVREIKLSGLSHKIAAGKKIALQATVIPSNATNKSIVWKSSNTKYATVNSKGVVSIKKAGMGKTVTITATAGDGSGKQASYKIKCMKGIVKKVAISGQKNLSLKPGKSIKLKAKVTASSKANKTLQWTSSNPKYVSVTNKGKVIAKKAGKGKTVKITAMATDGSGKKVSVKIRIK